jgi:hypothetical protein
MESIKPSSAGKLKATSRFIVFVGRDTRKSAECRVQKEKEFGI